MSGGKSGHIGGVERQTTLMARWLSEKGYEVSLLTWDEGQAEECSIDNVRIIKMCRESSGIHFLRFFTPRWTSLISAMKKANADIYYHNCAEYVTGQAAAWCKFNNKKFVYSLANDPGADINLPNLHKIRERYLYKFGVKNSDVVISQTLTQQNMLANGFNISSTIIPMPCPGPADDEYYPHLSPTKPFHILWIARIHPQKRADRLIKLAQQCPDFIFDLVGPSGDNAYSLNILKAAKNTENIKIHGSVERNKVSSLYKECDVLCCTSDYEGFPNTFIESWSLGLPIVTTFDPDGIITKNRLGKVASNINDLEKGLRELLMNTEKWRLASESCRQYYVNNHTVEQTMKLFENVFLTSYKVKNNEKTSYLLDKS
jgi:glycosyltransferase involved in cell wall biosynthesis